MSFPKVSKNKVLYTSGTTSTLAIVGDSIVSTVSIPPFTGEFDASGASTPTTNYSVGFKHSIGLIAASQSKGQLQLIPGISIPGWTTKDIDGIGTQNSTVNYWQTRVVSQTPDFVLLEIGFNDFSPSFWTSSTYTYMKNWITDKCNQIKSWGGIPILWMQNPLTTTWSATTQQKQEQFAFNQWLKYNAKSLGADIFDFADLVVDPASSSGEPLSSYSNGGDTAFVHPCNSFRRVAGVALWNQVLSKYFNSGVDLFPRSRFNAAGTGNLYNDPLLYTTGGSVAGMAGGSLPLNWNGWSNPSEITASIVADSDGVGNAIRLSQAATGAHTTVGALPGIYLDLTNTFKTQNNGNDLVPGDQIQISLKFRLVSSQTFLAPHIYGLLWNTFNGTSGSAIAIGLCNNSQSNNTIPDTTSYTLYLQSPILTIPVGYQSTQNFYLFVESAVSGIGTNVYEVSRIKVEKLNTY